MDQVVTKADPVRQLERGGLPAQIPDEEGLGTGLHRPAGERLGTDLSAQPPRPLQHDDVDVRAQFPQPLRRGQSGDAATDHHHAL